MDKDRIRPGQIITTEMLQDLPMPVQRYLSYSGVVDKPWINNVRLRQVGRFRPGIDRPWMPMTAEQHYTTDPPGFVWKAQLRIAGLPLVRAQDEYKLGHGHMLGKIAGLFTIFDVRGEELNQGAMIRYLSEMIWFPVAFLGKNVVWEGIDDTSAQVSFCDQGKRVSGRMFFNDQGRPINFTALRYREIAGEFSLDPWSTPITAYDVRAGLNLPIHGQAVWNLTSGDLPYVDMEITEVEYN